jgi:hypothetical protein
MCLRILCLLPQWGDTLWYEMTMWMYLGLSCLDHPFSAELDDMEVNTRI